MMTEQTELKKGVGFFGVFSLAAGSMISSGLFVLPGIAFAIAGPSVIFAYVLAALLYLPTMLSKIELATAMPKAGGSYFFVERSLGGFAGTLMGFVNGIAVALKGAFAFVGVGTLALLYVPQIGEAGMKLVAVAACLIFALINLIGVKEAGRLQGLFVAGLLGLLGGYLFLAFPHVESLRYTPFMPSGVGSLLAATGLVFVSYGGLTKVVDIAEEVHHPQKNLPLGIFGAFVIVNIFYVLTVFATVGVVKGELLSGSLFPIALGGGAVAGASGVAAIAAAALLAYATTGNAGILSASRSPMAMSRDGLLPSVFSRTNRRTKTPVAAILATTFMILMVIVFLTVEDLVKAASAMLLLSFIMVNISVVVMRKSGIQGYRPSFREPFHPWLPLSAVVIYSVLIFEMGTIPLVVTVLVLLFAAVWYLTYVHLRIDRESAFVYMVKSIVSKKIGRSGLEDELLQISLERDEVNLDRFDRLVRNGIVLDIEEKISARDLFKTLAKELAPRLKINPQAIYELFLQRERESSTVLQPGLAIPHIIVEGRDLFEVALVRCKEGAIFSELHPPVHAAFILMGSNDERNFHLKALMAIAHVVKDEEFENRWREAHNADQLRDVVVLSRRERMATS